MYSTRFTLPALLLAAMLTAAIGHAKNVDLSTVPARESVQLTIYNSEDLTLVRETRKVSFKPGANPLQFSWVGTLIDPTSVELRFVTHADELDVLDTTFPHDKPQMLYWNVQSEIDGEAVIEITYFTSGIRWTADYICISDTDETEMSFEGFVRVYNNSGEEYEDAQVRLVVGTVNLVEKIAQLAQIPMSKVADMEKAKRDLFLGRAAKEMVALADMAPSDSAAAGAPARPKQIVKEGLSEYFIYTIEGTETVKNGWSKRMRSFQGKTVPFDIQYRYRVPEYGDQLVRLYLMANDKDSGLGTTPLPNGMVRVFRDNGRDGLSFLVAQSIKYVPIGDKIELNLGPDPEVIFALIKLRAWRDNIWMHLNGTSVYRRVDDGRIKIEINSSVAGWDDHAVYAQRIRNYSDKPVDIEVRRSFGGHVMFRSSLPAKNFDYHTAEYTQEIVAGRKADLLYEIVQHQGHSKKQDNVTIEKAEIDP